MRHSPSIFRLLNRQTNPAPRGKLPSCQLPGRDAGIGSESYAMLFYFQQGMLCNTPDPKKAHPVPSVRYSQPIFLVGCQRQFSCTICFDDSPNNRASSSQEAGDYAAGREKICIRVFFARFFLFLGSIQFSPPFSLTWIASSLSLIQPRLKIRPPPI